MPSFRQILTGVTQAWKNDRERVLGSAGEVAEQLQALSDVGFDEGTLDTDVFRGALRGLSWRFDKIWGGFGDAPKFPQPMILEFLLRESIRSGDTSALDMAKVTLRKMAEGGMYDHLGGGFARYSVDHRWLVPHFEKMLYDNSQLARVYLHAWQLTGEELYRRVTEETLDYVLREMRHADGGFYSSQDADSEGIEGKFYVWSADEIREALGEDAEVFMRMYGISDAGNWEGSNILNLRVDLVTLAEEMEVPVDALDARTSAARTRLYEIRSKRVWPGLDDKVLTSWNGLMLGAFAEAGLALDRPDYLETAKSNAEFLYRTMRCESGRLLRTWKAGSEAKYNAYLEDYAYLADGLLALYEATFDERWVNWARELAEIMLHHFPDPVNGGFFDTSDDHEQLIRRPKDLQDNAVPSGNAMAASVLLRLSLLTGNGDYWQMAEKSVATMAKFMSEYPSGFGHWLAAATFVLSEPRELALIGSADEIEALLAVARDAYRPFKVIAAAEEGVQTSLPLLTDRPRIKGKGTAYLCRRFMCQAPTTDAEQLRLQLGSA
jgi:hypothetical protein